MLSTVATNVALLRVDVEACISVLSVASLKFVAFVHDNAKNPGLVVDTLKLVGAPGAFIVESTPES